ncbi:hypothetical protein STCU_11704 [Strigomonas culicis]|uniref:Uncharacterized protein n=1 Tax=Strigomonas culicis TaxID=28005 RepID=S9UMD8_9TRYP|nr:hypothetical protein STCU_11704 [Strigomonas culicis]|eukprot:EPY15876.1 hypothetical protein STCU_11704 [Strigomonas culicis]
MARARELHPGDLHTLQSASLCILRTALVEGNRDVLHVLSTATHEWISRLLSYPFSPSQDTHFYSKLVLLLVATADASASRTATRRVPDQAASWLAHTELFYVRFFMKCAVCVRISIAATK